MTCRRKQDLGVISAYKHYIDFVVEIGHSYISSFNQNNATLIHSQHKVSELMQHVLFYNINITYSDYTY